DVALAVDVLIHHFALHEAQGVEHLDDRHPPPLLERARDLRREPVVGVDDVVRALLLLDLGDQLLGELVEMLEHGHLRPVAKGSRLNMDHSAVGSQGLDAGVVLFPPAGEDIDPMSARAQIAYACETMPTESEARSGS